MESREDVLERRALDARYRVASIDALVTLARVTDSRVARFERVGPSDSSARWIVWYMTSHDPSMSPPRPVPRASTRSRHSVTTRGMSATVTTRARAIRLYRHTLRTVLSWCVDRRIFYDERDRVRAAFESNAGLRDAGAIERAVAEGEKTLESYAHPDPYIIPTMYGGSKYARNPEVPTGVGMVLDFGREPYCK